MNNQLMNNQLMNNQLRAHEQTETAGETMGKQTGFLEYERCENREIPAATRIRGFQEFHTPLFSGDPAAAGSQMHELRSALLPVRHETERHGGGLSAAQSDSRME